MWELFRDIYVICFHLILPVCCVCMCVYGVEGLSDFAEAGVCVYVCGLVTGLLLPCGQCQYTPNVTTSSCEGVSPLMRHPLDLCVC